MRNLKVSPAGPEDLPKMMAWGMELQHVPEMASPQEAVICVSNGKPITFAATKAAGVIAGLAADPKAWDGLKALALKHLVATMALLFDDVYFFAGTPEDEPLEKLALKNGFERMPWRVYRLTRRPNG